MINLDLSMLLFLYLFFSTLLLLIAWSFLDFGTKMKTFTQDEKFLWHCDICDYNYIDSMSEHISKCPRCGSYTEKQ